MLALSVSTYGQRFPFYNLSVENGLIQSQVTAIKQDKFGHLWIGTIGGVSRYDGNSFKNYTIRDGLLDNSVTALAIDNDNQIWIGGSNGITKYDGRSFTHHIFRAPENTSANSVQKIVIAEDNTVWSIVSGSVFAIDKEETKELSLPNENAVATSILPLQNTLYIATRQGLIYIYNNNNWDSIAYDQKGISNNSIITTDMLSDTNGRVWLAGNAGLFYIEKDKIKSAFVNKSDIKQWPYITSITQDNTGALWLGTTGAIKYEDSVLTLYNKPKGFTNNVVRCVYKDIEGNVWFGSNGNGIYRFSGGQFSTLDEQTGLQHEQVMSIGSTSNGRVYLGTSLGGLYYYEKGTVEKFNLPLPKNSSIQAIDIKNNYDVWMGTNGLGLLRYIGGDFKKYTTPEIPSNVIVSLYRDTSDRLWVGTSRGATIYHKGSFHQLNDVDGVVNSFVTIGNDSTLMAGYFGMKVYHDSSIYPFQTNSPADSSNAQCFVKQGNKLWIGTSDNGVICYDLKKHSSIVINKSSGLRSDFVYNIIADDEQNIWVGTGYGIHSISLQNDTPIIHFYGKGQGITGMESNQNAVHKMNDGSIWFGTTKGAIHYQPKQPNIKSKPVSIVLQSVKVFGNDIKDTNYYSGLSKWYYIPQNLELPYKKNNLTFTFQAVTMSGLEPIQYKYKIEGLDAPWSDWTTLNSVTYSALPPGDYTLNVVTNQQLNELSYPFTIVAPFHKTSWFRFLIFFTCILIGVSLQYIINRRKQNRLALLERLRKEEQNKVRERTAEDFHDEVGNKLTRINVLTNVLKSKGGRLSPESIRILDQIQDNTNELYNGTRDILWSLKPSNDNLYEIIHRLRDFGGELFSETEINFIFGKSDPEWRKYRLPLDVSRNFIMIFKEAMNNTLKYAQANNVKLEATLKPDNVIQILLKDDGIGFNIKEVVKGNGLQNMQNRANRINGKLYIDAHKNEGTSITLSFKLKEQVKK